MAYDKSEWARTRIVIDPSEMPFAESLLMLSTEEFGLLMRLLGYAAHAGLPTDMGQLSRMAGLSSVRTGRRLWGRVKRLFELVDGRWRPKPADWYSVYLEPVDRRDLSYYRPRLLELWGNTCAYCLVGEMALDIEHIVPLSRGGTNDPQNLTLACRRCNLKKGSRTAEEFGHPHVHEKAKDF